MRLIFLCLALTSLACKGPIVKPSKLMLETEVIPTSAPADKALLFIHRPRVQQGYGLYFGVWMDRQLIADLGNGHTTYLEVAPGTHTIVGRSAEVKTIVEADLAAGQIYDLYTKAAGVWIASFRLHPMNADSEERENIPAWMEEHRIVTLVPRDDPRYVKEQEKTQPKIDVILEEAAEGDHKIFELKPSDSR